MPRQSPVRSHAAACKRPNRLAYSMALTPYGDASDDVLLTDSSVTKTRTPPTSAIVRPTDIPSGGAVVARTTEAATTAWILLNSGLRNLTLLKGRAS